MRSYVQALEEQNAYYCRRMTEAYRAAGIVSACLALASIGLAMTMVALYRLAALPPHHATITLLVGLRVARAAGAALRSS